MRLWELARWDDSWDDLRVLAEVLSGRTVDSTGALAPLAFPDLRQRYGKFQSLRAALRAELE